MTRTRDSRWEPSQSTPTATVVTPPRSGHFALVALSRRIGRLGVSSLLVATFSPLALIVSRAGQQVLLAITFLDIPLQWGMHPGKNEDLNNLGALTGFDISITTFALIGLYGGLLLHYMIAPRNGVSRPLRLNVPLMCYMGFAVLSSLVAAHDVSLSLFHLWLLLQTYLLMIFVAGWVQTKKDLLFIIKLLLIGLVMESVIMLGIGLTGQGFRLGSGLKGHIDLYDNRAAGSLFTRVGGTVGSPNAAATYLVLLLILAVSVLLTGLDRSYKRLAGLGIGLGLPALMFTRSRAGWSVTVLGILVLCLVASSRGWLKTRLNAKSRFALITGFVVLMVLFYSSVARRVFSDDEGSAHSRVTMIRSAWHVILDHPLVGVGLNNYVFTLYQYAKIGDFVYVAHNTYLLTWSETGIGGLLAFLWFLTSTLRKGWFCSTSGDPLLAPLSLGFTVGILAHMGHMLVELIYNDRFQIQLLWLIAALLTALREMVRSQSRD